MVACPSEGDGYTTQRRRGWAGTFERWRGRRGMAKFLVRRAVNDTGIDGLLGVANSGRDVVDRFVKAIPQGGVAHSLHKALSTLRDKAKNKTKGKMQTGAWKPIYTNKTIHIENQKKMPQMSLFNFAWPNISLYKRLFRCIRFAATKLRMEMLLPTKSWKYLTISNKMQSRTFPTV